MSTRILPLTLIAFNITSHSPSSNLEISRRVTQVVMIGAYGAVVTVLSLCERSMFESYLSPSPFVPTWLYTRNLNAQSSNRAGIGCSPKE